MASLALTLNTNFYMAKSSLDFKYKFLHGKV